MALCNTARADLERSGLTAATISAAGFSSVAVAQAAKAVFGSDTDKTLHCNDVTAIPYHDLDEQRTEYTRYKLHGVPAEYKNYGKYRSPVGVDFEIYFPVGLKALLEAGSTTLIVTEGEKKALKSVQEGIACIGIAGIDCWFDSAAREAAKIANPAAILTFSSPVHNSIAEVLHRFAIQKIIVLGDSDLGGTSDGDIRRFKRLEIFTEALRYQFTHMSTAMTTCPPAAGEKVGLDDWLATSPASEVRAVLESAPTKTTTQTVATDLGDLLQREFPPRELLLGGWLAKRNLGMIFAARGAGKTLFSIECAIAIITGSPVFGWAAGEPTGVLYIDGEMAAAEMQSRFTAALTRAPNEARARLRIINPELSPRTPNLASEAGQRDISRILKENPDIRVVFVDNISTLCSNTSSENDAESWSAVQEWAVHLRARGYTVIFIHHAGKSGAQRGTSRREDVLDFVINLKLPEDYDPADGACFECHFEKHRAFKGDDAAAKTIELKGNAWAVGVVESLYAQVLRLTADGMSQADIGRELDINRSSVSRILKKAQKRVEIADGI